jgi:hypothetical protein
VLRQLREDELLPSFAAAAPEAHEVRVAGKLQHHGRFNSAEARC